MRSSPTTADRPRQRGPLRLRSLLWLPLLGSLVGCIGVPRTVADDPALPYVELDGYRFHVQLRGDARRPPVIVVHGGPGGDLQYLLPLQALAERHFVVFYDQRGTGLSPRVPADTQTLERHLEDLHRIVGHYGQGGPVRLIGHSWGAMLVIAYLARHPERVSHAVAVEPGMLHPAAATEFVRRFKDGQSPGAALALLKHLAVAPFVSGPDGHERTDYVMTRLMNRASPGGPYQCAGESLPSDAFTRAGYAAFAQMLKPVLDRPERFSHDLTQGLASYRGALLMISSECSFIGHAFQQQQHMPLMPAQTVHLKAPAMGHNMLTLNPAWSVATIDAFFDGRVLP